MRSFFLILPLLIGLMGACHIKKVEPEIRNKKVSFNLRLENTFKADVNIGVLSANSTPAGDYLNGLYYYIFDENGIAVGNPGEQLRYLKGRQLQLLNNRIEEELATGNYTFAFLGLADTNSTNADDLQEIVNLTDTWLENDTLLKLPVKGEYFYTLVPFQVIPQKQDPVEVRLYRTVGRVELDLQIGNSELKKRIQKIEVEYDPNQIYTQMQADGTLTNPQSIRYTFSGKLTPPLYFYSFPSQQKNGVTGKILVTVLKEDNTLATQEFPFTNAPVPVNGKVILHLSLSPAQNIIQGTLKIETAWEEDIYVNINA